MRLEGQRVLVTGAGGFIGSQLCEELLEIGAEVRAFVRYNSRSDYGMLERLGPAARESIEVHAGDLKDPEAVRQAVRGREVVFHLGALISIPSSYVNPLDHVQTNTVGTVNVLNAARDLGVRKVVHTSTSEVYGTARYAPIDEEHPLQGQSPYSASKIGADQLALSYFRSFDVPVAILRPFNTYGPRQSARAIIPTIITQVLTQEVLHLGALHPTRDLTFVRDTVAGFIAIARADEAVGQVVNVGTGREISIGDLAAVIMRLIGRQLEIVTDTQRMRPEKSEVERLLCDPRKAKRLLDWEPRFSLEQGLEETIEWVRNNSGLFRASAYQV